MNRQVGNCIFTEKVVTQNSKIALFLIVGCFLRLSACVYVDSVVLGALSGPVLMAHGSHSTYHFGKLLSYLHYKPRQSKVVHVIPLRHPSGKVTTATHITVSKPFNYNYLTAPLPHPPLKPKMLQSPLGESQPFAKYNHLVGSSKFYRGLPPVVSPPYLPYPLLYRGNQKFSSPYS